MTVNELIEKLKYFQNQGFGDTKTVDCSLMGIEGVRPSTNVDYNTGNEYDVIVVG